MNMFVIDRELLIRLGFFLGIFMVMSAWEVIVPRRRLTQKKAVRWLNNLLLTGINSALLLVIFPMTAVGIAQSAHNYGWGIFNLAGFGAWTAGLFSIILLDLAIYSQHRYFHRFPLFWSIHKMHHTDLDIDVTTGARFHPIEIIISMGIKIAVVVALGAPAWSVAVFEVLLNGTSMFNHSNVFLQAELDRILRLITVTPDMHRVHHSIIGREINSNFGFNFPWWDRLFGTYRDQPEEGHTAMTIGIAEYQDPKWLTLGWMMAVPFSRTEISKKQ
jgi:sterol desaturase/sphingolipid hydroxylase (fatty acid hydroxylase superfamily)